MDRGHCNSLWYNDLKRGFRKPPDFSCSNGVQMVVIHIVKSTISLQHIHLSLCANLPRNSAFLGVCGGLRSVKERLPSIILYQLFSFVKKKFANFNVLEFT